MLSRIRSSRSIQSTDAVLPGSSRPPQAFVRMSRLSSTTLPVRQRIAFRLLCHLCFRSSVSLCRSMSTPAGPEYGLAVQAIAGAQQNAVASIAAGVHLTGAQKLGLANYGRPPGLNAILDG